jgi:hypothetical protein
VAACAAGAAEYITGASGHDFERVALLTDSLEAEGIGAVVRNERLRAAFTFFGPHLPLEVPVAERHADDSRAVIARVDAGLGLADIVSRPRG